MDELKQQPIEEKKSRNLGFGDFFKDQLAWSLVIPAAGLLGYVAGKVGKIYPFDGSPMILSKLYEKLIHGGLSKIIGEKVEVSEVERLGVLTQFLPESERLEATHSIWNSLKAMEVAAVPFAYHLWRKKEKNEVELKDAYEKLQDLPYVKPSNAELKEENTSLKQQLDFVDKHENNNLPDNKLLSSNSNLYEGKMESTKFLNASL